MAAQTGFQTNTSTGLAWGADTERELSVWEFEGLARAVFDLSAISWLAASWETRTDVSRQPTWHNISDRYRDTLNDELRVSRVRYENPFEVEVAIIGATPALLTAAAAVATLLMTGSALRRKYLAEARKTNAEAARSEYDLNALIAAAAERRRDPDAESAVPPEADGTWEDVAEVLTASESESQRYGVLKAFHDNGSFSRSITALRARAFGVRRFD